MKSLGVVALVEPWPQIDSSVSVHPARSCTQHPHCLLCQRVEAALPSSGGCLRQAKIHVSLFLIFCMLHLTAADPLSSSFSLLLSVNTSVIYTEIIMPVSKKGGGAFSLSFFYICRLSNPTNGDSKNRVNLDGHFSLALTSPEFILMPARCQDWFPYIWM